MSFNATTFAGAMTKDPAAAKAMFAGTDAAASGRGGRSASPTWPAHEQQHRLDRAVDPGTQLDDQGPRQRIDDWDDRLAASRVSLQRQYSALETAPRKMKSQATWLSGQISSLG